MKAKKRPVSFYVWIAVYAILGALLVFLAVWNICLALKLDFAISMRSAFNTSVRKTEYYASSDLLLQTLFVLTSAILVSILIIRDNHAKKIERLKRKVRQSNSILEENK